MPLEEGKSKEVVRRNTKRLIDEGYEPAQAYAIANKKAGRTRRKRKRPALKKKR